MAYNSFYGYQPTYPFMQQNQSNIYWIQGIEGAKAHPVGAGNSVILMDSDASVFYIKTADQSGVPSLRIFDYTEREGDKPFDLTAYITRDEFNDVISKLSTKDKKKKKKDDDDDEED